MTTLALLALALVILGCAAVALSLRNLIHSALLFVVCWAGIAGFYLWAGAEFVAFAQALVYVGAVSMVVLFAILLTRPAPSGEPVAPSSVARAAAALVTGGAVFGVLAGGILSTRLGVAPATPTPTLTVRSLGYELMGPHAAALLIVGALLTVALLGAIVLASVDRPDSSDPGPHS